MTAVSIILRCVVLLLTACSALAGSCCAQTCKHHNFESTGTPETALAPILAAPIGLQPGIGNAHEEITTASPQAQRYYDQGLSYLYSYDWIHASRSFNQALRLDPKLAMAYLGLSYVYSAFADNGRAGEMVSKAKELGQHASAAERMRIELREKQLQAIAARGGDQAPGLATFASAIDEALAKDGNNVDLLLMRGAAAEGYAAAIGQRGGRESISYYEKVLQLEPENAAAHHFLVHSNEMINNLPEALKHAEAYQRLAPLAAHAHHMYGHDLRRSDQVSQAISQFERAKELTEANYKSEPGTLLYDWNYRHNLNLMAAAYEQAGLLPAAMKTLTKLSELKSITPADDLYKAQLPAFLLRGGKTLEAMTQASQLGESKFGVGRVLAHTLAGSSAARRGESAKALEQLSLAEKEAADLDPVWHNQVDGAMELLRSQTDFLEGRRELAAGRLRRRVLTMRALPGSDAWSDAMFHIRLIAEIAMDYGDWDLARFAAHQLAEHAPFYTGTHSLLSRIAEYDRDASGTPDVNPCVDFYQYACGNWMKANPIPPDYPGWSGFVEMYERNLIILRGILEQTSVSNPKRRATFQKIRDYYASCMDETAINKAGLTPLQPEFDRIAALKDKSQMMELIAHEMLIGSNSLLVPSSMQDEHDPRLMAPLLGLDGLTLPGRDYYLRDEAAMLSLRQALAEHANRMFVLFGQTPERAAESAAAVVRIETELARAAMHHAAPRDSAGRYQSLTLAQAEELAPNLRVSRYFAVAGAPAFHELQVGNPASLGSANSLLDRIPLEDWKAYLTWHVLHASAAWLSDPFAQEDFKFRQKLTGQQTPPARWKRCVESTDTVLGEALGQFYVEKTFSIKDKQRVSEMVTLLKEAVAGSIKDMDWLSPSAKREALEKAAAIRYKIGYPETWRDYSGLDIVRGDMLGNLQRATMFEHQRQLRKIGKELDQEEWAMTPSTADAYYSPERNEIVLPAGVLQPPLYDPAKDDAENFGAIGQIIGHELTHGFNLSGSGAPQEASSDKDRQEYERRLACFVGEYGNFTIVGDLPLDGRLTLQENMADNAGARIALSALHKMLGQDRQAPERKTSGYTAEQRFFQGFARVWCENVTPELSRLARRADPHAPGRWRVNGVVRNMPEFQEAFACTSGQPMVAENACRVW
jgi:predicted metalloendopeptidase/Tfp pilus assembly protein PilF